MIQNRKKLLHFIFLKNSVGNNQESFKNWLLLVDSLLKTNYKFHKSADFKKATRYAKILITHDPENRQGYE